MPRLLRPSAVLAIVLALNGCTAEAVQPADAVGSPPGAGSDLLPHQHGPAGPVPQGLERFYSQRLSWGACPGFATTSRDRKAFANPRLQCTRVEVPLDYAKPHGRTAWLGLLRLPATHPPERLGSLLVNPGGPGVSGMHAVASLAAVVARTELGRRFDVVGFDPRGVGVSQPKIVCRTTQEQDAARLDRDLDTSFAGIAQTESQNRTYAALCAQRVGKDVLATVGTRDVARDLDVMRSVLGDTRLTYLGYSYGTRIGTSYAEQFPGNVRAMVLDGALEPNENLVESLANEGAGLQQSFDAFVGWCLGQPHCWLGSAPKEALKEAHKEEASRRFQQLVRPLTTAPQPVGDRKLSYTDASIGTIQGLYTDRLWPVLSRGLIELATGNGSTLLRLADLYYQRDDHGYSGSQDAFKAVRCVDDPPVTDPAVIWQADRYYRQAAPFLDDGHPPSAARDTCAFWPVPPSGGPPQSQVEGLPPVLVISTTGDPATPYQAGVELARQLRGKLVSFEGNQHTVALQGVQCVDDAVSAYLVRLVLPKRSTLCVS